MQLRPIVTIGGLTMTIWQLLKTPKDVAELLTDKKLLPIIGAATLLWLLLSNIDDGITMYSTYTESIK